MLTLEPFLLCWRCRCQGLECASHMAGFRLYSRLEEHAGRLLQRDGHTGCRFQRLTQFDRPANLNLGRRPVTFPCVSLQTKYVLRSTTSHRAQYEDHLCSGVVVPGDRRCQRSQTMRALELPHYGLHPSVTPYLLSAQHEQSLPPASGRAVACCPGADRLSSPSRTAECANSLHTTGCTPSKI